MKRKNELPQILDYELKKSVAGTSVKYDCPNCRVRLTSALMEAGRRDQCPDCAAGFIVPGDKEKLEEAKRQLEIKKARAHDVSRRKTEAHAATTRRLAEEAKREKELQLDRDPLREWLVYVAIIGVLLTLSAGNHLLSAIASDRSGLCIMIIGLFAFGLLLNFRAIKNLRSEFVCAAFLVKKLKSPHGFSELVQSTPAGVFHQHIQDLVKIARHDPNVSQDSLITLLYSRMMSRSKIIDVLSGVLVSLGLIGTIVGLISMTNGLSETLDSLGESGDATALMVGMRGTMQGLGTAFYTTLVGAILGSVVLRILNNVYTSNVDHFVSYIASLTEVRITPRLRKKSRGENSEVLVGEVIE